MKLSKHTIEKVKENGFDLYSATKKTNKYGTFITAIYAVRYFKDGICTAVSTERKETFEGSTQQDIIKHFPKF